MQWYLSCKAYLVRGMECWCVSDSSWAAAMMGIDKNAVVCVLLVRHLFASAEQKVRAVRALAVQLVAYMLPIAVFCISCYILMAFRLGELHIVFGVRRFNEYMCGIRVLGPSKGCQGNDGFGDEVWM